MRVVRRLAAYLDSQCLWMCVADTRGLLAGAAETPFQAAHAKPIADQRHLEACWRYVASNRERHGVAGGLGDCGSGLADVLGARRLPGFDASRWAAHLPRRTVVDMARDLGLPAGITAPAPLDAVRALGAVHLARVAAGAVGWPDLMGRTPDQVHARASVVRLGLSAGLARTDLAFAVGVGRQATYELAAREDRTLDDYVLQRITFEATVGR